MSEAEMQGTRVVAFAAAMAAAVLLQRVAPHAARRGSWRVNGALLLAGALTTGIVCGGCAFTVARWATLERVGVLNLVSVGSWMPIAISVVALDLVSYGWHVANHRLPVLWRFHQVHHSDPGFTVSTAVRFHPGELLLSLPVRLAAIVVLGAPVEAVLTFEVAFTFANLVEHGDIQLPRRLERVLGCVLITPALHRRHHARLASDRDTNFGTIFSVWDRLLGTRRYSDSAARIATGLPGLGRVTLVRALLLPAR